LKKNFVFFFFLCFVQSLNQREMMDRTLQSSFEASSRAQPEKKKRKRPRKKNESSYVLQPIQNVSSFSHEIPMHCGAPNSDIKLRQNLLSIYDTTSHLLEQQATSMDPQTMPPQYVFSPRSLSLSKIL